jgi:hypothetical protein
MTIYYILSLASRLAGFVQLAEFFWTKHEQKVKAQKVADAPSTRPELEKTLEDGNL